MPRRILQVFSSMNRGGSETMIMNYYRNMDRSKVQFDFLLHRDEEGHYDKEIEALGGKIYRLCPITPFNYYKYKNQLNEFFKNNPNYKIVHSHMNSLSSIVLGIAKKHQVPHRIAHSHLAVEPFSILKIFRKNTDIVAVIKDNVHNLIKKRVRKVATEYLACGEKAGIWLYGKNEKNVKVINNAVHADQFIYNENLSNRVRQELNISKSTTVIGHVGRFDEQKNHFFLIEIFHAYLKKNPDCVLLLVGGGVLENKIKNLVERKRIKDQVKFLGIRADVPRMLQVFELFLFPSLYEGLPVTAMEAQAAGLPIVTSSTVTDEIDITGKVSYISLKSSPNIWAEAMEEALKYKRINTYDMIVKGGYDIVSNAKLLQEYYLILK